VEKKIGSGQKYAFSSSKAQATLKKQTAGSSSTLYRELGQKIQIYHSSVKKYLKKM
jgi:ATP-dependent protease HslVU (ClpYQ) peptidase subunit